MAELSYNLTKLAVRKSRDVPDLTDRLLLLLASGRSWCLKLSSLII